MTTATVHQSMAMNPPSARLGDTDPLDAFERAQATRSEAQRVADIETVRIAMHALASGDELSASDVASAADARDRLDIQPEYFRASVEAIRKDKKLANRISELEPSACGSGAVREQAIGIARRAATLIALAKRLHREAGRMVQTSNRITTLSNERNALRRTFALAFADAEELKARTSPDASIILDPAIRELAESAARQAEAIPAATFAENEANDMRAAENVFAELINVRIDVLQMT